MADNFNGKYIRVLTPKTTNGVVPKLSGGRQQYKETHLPYSSLPLMQAQNSKLKSAGQEHLQHILEIIGDDGPVQTEQTIAARSFRPQRVPRSNPQPGMSNNRRQSAAVAAAAIQHHDPAPPPLENDEL